MSTSRKYLKALAATTILVSALHVAFASEQAPLNTQQHSSQRPDTFSNIVSMTSPAVVNISTTQKIEVKNPLDDFRFDFPEGSQYDFFREFFDREFGGGGENEKFKKAMSLGSGFIVDPSGYIVTNNHVVAEADEVSVTLSDDPEKTYKAKLIGKDPKTDLAVIKIEGTKPFPFLKFGDSNQSMVGDWIIAVGNPFGLGGTVTAGIISAKSRFIPGQYDEFIQTDASINRGNSGGPMINMNGEVIGVNSVIISPSGGNVGIGFAIPSNQVKPIFDQLKDKGSIVRGWLGVKIQMVSEDIAKNLGLPEAKGALVSEVTKDSPSDKAGIKVGDVITKFDGQPINNMQKLPRLVAETPIGKNVKIEVIRDTKVINLETRVTKPDQENPEDTSAKQDKNDQESTDRSSALGMKLEQLTPGNRTKYRVDKAVNGVVVTSVGRSSIARDAGIKPGDVIVKFNRVQINNPIDLQKSIVEAKKSGAKNAVFLVNRANSNIFIVMDLE